MADVKGLLADPQFNQLGLDDQRQALGRIDPSFVGLSDQDYQTFKQKMSPAPQPQYQQPSSQPSPGFWGEMYNKNIQPFADAYHAIQNAPGAQDGPEFSLGGAVKQGVKDSFPGLQLMRSVGSDIGHAATNLYHGNWGAGGADVLTLGLQAFGPKFLSKIADATEAATGGMRGLYSSAMNYPKDMSLAQMDATSKLGLSNEINATRGGLKKLGDVNDVKSVIGKGNEQTKSLVSAHANTPLDWDTVEAPIKKSIQTASQAANSTDYAKQLIDELSNFRDKWRIGKGPLTMQKAQDIKQATYKMINDSLYSDNASSVPAANKSAAKSFAQGLKDAQNQVVPEMQKSNDTVHHAILLKDAIMDQVKGNPSNLASLVKAGSFAAAGGGAGALMGQPMAGEIMTAGLATKALLENPATASMIANQSANLGKGVASHIVVNTPRLADIFTRLKQQPQ